jgi:HK97 family phage major capsid protein
METNSMNVEIKSADAGNAFGDLHRAFAAFREANDERLAQIEHRLSSDVVTEEKLARIDRTLDETKRRLDQQTIEKSRPLLSAERGRDDAGLREHKTAFGAYMRGGESAGLKAIEEKAMSAGSGPDGGFLVPQPAEREILQRLANVSPIRAISTVREISTATFRKAFPVGAPVAGWTGETDARAQTTSPQLADMNFPAMELFAMPAATQTLLDDSAIDVEQWLAEEIDSVFAEQEGSAFVSGDGVNKPTGFLSYPVSTHATWTWGRLGYTPTGAAGAFAASNPSDQIIDLIYALRAGYRQNARFVMNRKTQAAVRKLKSSGGDYLWQPPASADQNATLMGFPVTEAENMPDIAAGSNSIAFGDFRRGYLVVDRLGVRVLRDPYSAKPYVLFYTTKRVGGGVQDFDAIKLLKFAAS